MELIDTMNAKTKGTVNLITSLAYKVITVIVGFILPKLFITTYGSEINGLQSSVNQIFAYISLIEGGIGAATLQALYAPVANENKQKINAYLSATSVYYNQIGVVYFILLTVIGIGYALIVPVEGCSFGFVFLYILFSGALSGINFFYLGKLKLLISAKGDEYVVTALTMCTFLATSIMKIVLISMGVNIVILQVCYLAINLIVTYVYYRIAKRKYPWLSFRETPDNTCIAQKNSVLLHRISAMIFQNIDVVLLTFMCGLKVVSIYTIYKMIVGTVTTVVTTMGDSVHFIFGQTYNADADKEKYMRIIDTFNVYYSAVSFALFSVMFLLIIPFLRIYTKGMDQSYIFEALPYLYISIELLTVGREAMMRTIEVAGHFKKTQWRAVAESAINLIVSVVAILVCKQYWGDVGGLYGALLGTIVAMLYRTIDINIYANRKILQRSCGKSFWVIGGNVLTLLFTVFGMKPFVGTCDSYLAFFRKGLWMTPVVLVFSLLVQSVLNRKEARTMMQYLKKRP